ncbi:MAG: asparagine synthase (glutamine-hydrolyzing) [Candidatus Aminicenantes bacterium]|nr:MAG: asparagine synthase (glutamine-hydrolyzing) [Candidatus Aminicenantes bacterium]
MCGICGIVNFNGTHVKQAYIEMMMRLLKHRGPDDEGLYIDKNIGLGNVRLSIIDRSPAGHQPMFSQDKRYCLIYNGEVYNYLELKETLKEKYMFHTRTDTEEVLNAFREWGLGCLEKFNGMFSFAIYDTKTGELFIARDRFGIKPFYYHLDEHRCIFASEERAILPFLRAKKPNNQAIYEYLIYNRTDQGEHTFFKGIQKLPHGSCGIVKGNRLKIQKWYRLTESLRKPFEHPSEFYETFRQSVALRLRSDVPVGVCLSGGLDSSTIVSVLLNEFGQTDLNTFSAVYEKEDFADESKFINQYRNDLKNMFFIRPSAGSLSEDLPRFLKCHSEPVSTLGPYAQFKVMELAKKHVGVTLDGQGADEQLAGYPYFFGGYFNQLFREIRWLRLVTELSTYAIKYKSLYAFKYFVLYLIPRGLKDSLIRMSHNYVAHDFVQKEKSMSIIKEKLYDSRSLNESLIQHFEYKLEHLLKWEDHNSMAHSLESRVPFLDHHLVERTLALSAEKIIHKATSKLFLRQAVENILPETIRTRQDKVNFATPWENWFKTEKLQKQILDLLHSKKFKDRGYLNPGRCLKGYHAHLRGKINIAKEIWKWLNLELWLRMFFD